jgi:hypothetical protein
LGSEARLPVLREKFHLLERQKAALPQPKGGKRADPANGEHDEGACSWPFHRFTAVEERMGGVKPFGWRC